MLLISTYLYYTSIKNKGLFGYYGFVTMKHSIFGAEKDIQYMQEALVQARKAYAQDEVPIGAVLVDADGTIVARGYNMTESRHTQLAHAECLVLAQAGHKLNDWRLDGCWLYVTLQPCGMCMHAIRLSRVRGVVYGASSPLFGYHLDTGSDLRVYKKDAFAIIPNVQTESATALMKQFFKEKRKKGEYTK